MFELVKSSLEALNEELNYDTLKNITDATPVFGGEDGIDSLSLITLIAYLEDTFEREFKRQVSLDDERALSMRNSPYRTAGSVTDFLLERLRE